MCHPGTPFKGTRENIKQERWAALQMQLVVEAMNFQAQAAAAGGGEAGRATSGGDGRGTAGNKLQCVCSPTSHPGSFRCRHHKSEYQWVGRMKSSSSAPSKNTSTSQ